MADVTVESRLDEDVKEDAERVRDILSKHGDSRFKAVVDGGSDAIRVTFISGQIKARFVTELEKQFSTRNFVFNSSSELYIGRR